MDMLSKKHGITVKGAQKLVSLVERELKETTSAPNVSVDDVIFTSDLLKATRSLAAASEEDERAAEGTAAANDETPSPKKTRGKGHSSEAAQA